MRRHTLAAAALLAALVCGDAACSRTYTDAELYPVHVGDKIGFIDRSGKVVIEPRFTAWRDFSEGLAFTYGEQDGFIDTRGKMVFPFAHGMDFMNGLAAVRVDDRWGFIDRKGHMAIQPQWDGVSAFVEGFACVWRGDRAGFINETGTLVVPITFAGLAQFSGGLAVARAAPNGLWGFIDKSGAFAIAPQYTEAHSFSEGLARVQIRQLTPDGQSTSPWGFIDGTGTMVIPARFQGDYSAPTQSAPGRSAMDFSEGLAMFCDELQTPKGGILQRCGYLDKTGKEVIPAQWHMAWPFSEGLAAVEGENLLWGYIDKKGTLVIPYQFDGAGEFRGGLAEVAAPLTQEETAERFRRGGGSGGLQNKRGYIDKTGRYIWQPSR